jgi:hypothetical protein
MLFAAAVMISAPMVGNGCAQSSLVITYGSRGIEQLSYKGIGLEDLGQNPSDAFHIWHMKTTDRNGKVLSQGQYGWGEVNNGRSWNAVTHTWTYNFIWGSISVRFTQNGDALNIDISTNNHANSGVIFDGATVYPFALHFPQSPAAFGNASAAQYSFNVNAPSVLVADYAQGEIASVVPDATRSLYSGFLPSSQTYAYTPIVSTTPPDELAVFLPHNDRALQPGQSDTATVSLRFAPSGTPASSIAADVYKNWATAWPMQINWSDRRIVGTVYLASSPRADAAIPSGFTNNPRRYFSESDAQHFNVNTKPGLVAFEARVLKQAEDTVHNLQRLNAQGAITWDIEGEQYPQPTSYACAPDQIAKLAPEMESVITVPGSRYDGMKLDDAYFKTQRDAGFKVGVCIRPQHLRLMPSGTAQQVYLSGSSVEAELLGKMKFAHDRWGATLFYVDTSVEADGAVLSPDIFKHLGAALPDSLLIPEESTPKHYAYSAPLRSFLFHYDLATDRSIYNYYPRAFSLNLINDVDASKLAQYTPQLVEAVGRGDVLMVHADYWQANNSVVMQIYQAASGK